LHCFLLYDTLPRHTLKFESSSLGKPIPIIAQSRKVAKKGVRPDHGFCFPLRLGVFALNPFASAARLAASALLDIPARFGKLSL